MKIKSGRTKATHAATEAQPSAGAELLAIAGRVSTRLRCWGKVYRQRKELRQLGDDILKDLGISRVDAQREGDRPFWDNGGRSDETLRVRSRPIKCRKILSGHDCHCQSRDY